MRDLRDEFTGLNKFNKINSSYTFPFIWAYSTTSFSDIFSVKSMFISDSSLWYCKAFVVSDRLKIYSNDRMTIVWNGFSFIVSIVESYINSIAWTALYFMVWIAFHVIAWATLSLMLHQKTNFSHSLLILMILAN